jgi:hypothetical protein
MPGWRRKAAAFVTAKLYKLNWQFPLSLRSLFKVEKPARVLQLLNSMTHQRDKLLEREIAHSSVPLDLD